MFASLITKDKQRIKAHTKNCYGQRAFLPLIIIQNKRIQLFLQTKLAQEKIRVVGLDSLFSGWVGGHFYGLEVFKGQKGCKCLRHSIHSLKLLKPFLKCIPIPCTFGLQPLIGIHSLLQASIDVIHFYKFRPDFMAHRFCALIPACRMVGFPPPKINALFSYLVRCQEKQLSDSRQTQLDIH